MDGRRSSMDPGLGAEVSLRRRPDTTHNSFSLPRAQLYKPPSSFWLFCLPHGHIARFLAKHPTPSHRRASDHVTVRRRGTERWASQLTKPFISTFRFIANHSFYLNIELYDNCTKKREIVCTYMNRILTFDDLKSNVAGFHIPLVFHSLRCQGSAAIHVHIINYC